MFMVLVVTEIAKFSRFVNLLPLLSLRMKEHSTIDEIFSGTFGLDGLCCYEFIEISIQILHFMEQISVKFFGL